MVGLTRTDKTAELTALPLRARALQTAAQTLRARTVQPMVRPTRVLARALPMAAQMPRVTMVAPTAQPEAHA